MLQFGKEPPLDEQHAIYILVDACEAVTPTLIAVQLCIHGTVQRPALQRASQAETDSPPKGALRQCALLCTDVQPCMHSSLGSLTRILARPVTPC